MHDFIRELDREMSNKAILRKLSARLLGSQKYIKRSCHVYFKQQNEVMFFS